MRPAARLRHLAAAALAPLRGPYLYALIALAALLTTAAYQIGGDFRWDMGDRNLSAFLVNFTGPERAGDVPFRWTAPSARLQAPLVGAFAGTARLRLNGESWGGPPREATVQINDGPVHSIRLSPGWNEYAVPFSRDDLAGGDLKVRLRIPEAQIPPAQRDPRDTRHLGVPVESIAVERTGRGALPPGGMLAGAAAGAALIFALGVRLGARPRPA